MLTIEQAHTVAVMQHLDALVRAEREFVIEPVCAAVGASDTRSSTRG